MLPIVQANHAIRSTPIAPLFPADTWAVLGGSIDREGSQVTLAGGLRPLSAPAGVPTPLPQWAWPRTAQHLELVVPSSGVIVGRLLVTTNGAWSVYGIVASASWAYVSVSWSTAQS